MQTPVAKTEGKRFNATRGVDDMNLAELPIFYIGSKVPAGLSAISYEATLGDVDRGTSYVRKTTITSDAHGLPTERDGDVLLALMLIADQQSDERAIREGKSHPQADLSRGDMIDLLEWPRNGKSYKRLELAFDRWAGTTLKFFNWKDPATGKFGTKKINVIDNYELYDERDSGGQKALPLSYVRFTSSFWEIMQQRYFRTLNFDVYRRLSSPVSKQAFRFLTKRLAKKSSMEMDLINFACGHLGYSRNNSPSKLRQRLKPILEELADIGMIRSTSDDERYTKQGPGVYSIRIEKGSLPDASNETGNPLLDQLISLGLNPTYATKAIAKKDADLDYIAFLIDYLDWLQETKNTSYPNNVGGWLRKGIDGGDFVPMKEYKPKAEREAAAQKLIAAQSQRDQTAKKRDAIEQAKADAVAAKKAAEWASVETYLNSLSPAEREICIDDAFKSSAGHIAMKWARAYRKNPDDKASKGMGLGAYRDYLTKHVLALLPTV